MQKKIGNATADTGTVPVNPFAACAGRYCLPSSYSQHNHFRQTPGSANIHLYYLRKANSTYDRSKEDALKKSFLPKLSVYGTAFARGSGFEDQWHNQNLGWHESQ